MKLAEHPLLKSHLGKSAILDSNLLLLAWCCKFDPLLLNTFKRLNSFEAGDLLLLSETLNLFSTLWTTPHVLTEVSNLANSLPSWIRERWSEFFSKQILLIHEAYEPSCNLASDPVAFRFGLTDSALTRLASNHVILTTDWPLCGLLESRKLPVVNFNRLREAELSL
ncbi:MAG TPA: hypothetical protein VGR47_22880 [Terracidiphilus sp.]|nr:hypothetical protein [Terracidiphilus sp.]